MAFIKLLRHGIIIIIIIIIIMQNKISQLSL